MEKHTVSRLIGAPPGYVGFDQGGLLTDGVDQHPHCVLLLDEMEKAHPDVYNILLQVMDNGKLTDHNGRTVDFRNVVLIMTSNAGAAEQAKEALGFGRARREGEDTAAVERLFTPEFRNRLDAIISFKALPREVILQVVEKFVLQLEAQLMDRNVQIELTPEAASWLAEKGYDDKMGARPLGRVIQEHIKKPLAEELLFGKLTKGGLVQVTVRTATSRSRSSRLRRRDWSRRNRRCSLRNSFAGSTATRRPPLTGRPFQFRAMRRGRCSGNGPRPRWPRRDRTRGRPVRPRGSASSPARAGRPRDPRRA